MYVCKDVTPLEIELRDRCINTMLFNLDWYVYLWRWFGALHMFENGDITTSRRWDTASLLYSVRVWMEPIGVATLLKQLNLNTSISIKKRYSKKKIVNENMDKILQHSIIGKNNRTFYTKSFVHRLVENITWLGCRKLMLWFYPFLQELKGQLVRILNVIFTLFRYKWVFFK